MDWINYILFPIITLMGFYYLLAERVYVLRDGFIPDKFFALDNKHFLFLFILATGIIGCGSFMADRLLVSMLLLTIGLFKVNKPIPLSPTILIYGLYLAWLIVSIIFFSPVKTYGGRVFLKYLYPFIIMLFASQITDSSQFYWKALKVILWVAFYGVAFMLVLQYLPYVNPFFWSFTFWLPGIIDFLPVAITISLLLYSYFGKFKYLLYAVLFVLPSIFLTNRTGLLAASITIVIFAAIRYKARSLPYVVVGVAVLIGTILYVPEFRDKMFKKQMSTEEVLERRDELTRDDIDSSGRFAMWDWSLDHFYKDKELTGSGLGVLQETFYSLKHPFGELRVVHNDYVQMLCDTGIIGLVLFLLTALSLIIHSLIIYFRSKKYVLKMAAFIAGVSLAGMLSTLYTDNVVNYSLMTLSYPFALYGMMLGLKKQYPDDI